MAEKRGGDGASRLLTEGRCALAIAPLALDAVAGCGGTLADLAAQGVRVHYLVVYTSRILEDRLGRACRILGIVPENVISLGMGTDAPEGQVRSRIRRALAELSEHAHPLLAFLPSLRSADPRDAWVAQEAFDVLRGRTLLAYDRVSRPFNASRPVVIPLSQAQMRAKLRAMRPRRYRAGASANPGAGPAAELLEVLEWRPNGQAPIEPVCRAACVAACASPGALVCR